MLLYKFGQFQYTLGQYASASDYLYHFRVLSSDTNLVLSSHWGKLASDILEGSWDHAMEELNGLREHIDQRGGAGPGGPLLALQQRTWWLHWSLFVYFNHPNGRESLLENWLNQNYLNTLQTACPWLLRYLVSAVVIARKSTLRSAAVGNSARSRESVREVVRALEQERYQYQDPITEFLRKLYGEVDFEGARKEMTEATAVLEGDFFLEEFKDEFVENARYLVSEAYCRIHHKIDIGYVFGFLSPLCLFVVAFGRFVLFVFTDTIFFHPLRSQRSIGSTRIITRRRRALGSRSRPRCEIRCQD